MNWPFVKRSKYERAIDERDRETQRLSKALESLSKFTDTIVYWEQRCEALYDPERCQPQATAVYVSELDCSKQAEFLVHLAKITDRWHKDDPRASVWQQLDGIRKELQSLPNEDSNEVEYLIEQLREYMGRNELFSEPAQVEVEG